MARVELHDLGKLYLGPQGRGIWALRHATLTVAAGEFVVLVGPSGAGKSTLLRLLAGLEEATQGAMAIDGQDVTRLEPKDRDIAMVFQNHALFPHLTVYENMALGLVLRTVPHAQIQPRVREAAGLLGLEPCLDRKPDALSGGERQRAALGRALVRQPKVFLFDEPLSNLDAPRRAQMREEILRLHRRLGATMLHVTHDQAEAMSMGDRVVVLHEGLIQQVAEPLALYHHPANLFVAGFIGAPPMNLLRGRMVSRDGSLCFQSESATGDDTPGLLWRLDDGAAAPAGLVPGRQVVCGVRPENVECFFNASSGEPAGWAIVERAEPVGADIHLHLRCAGQPLLARVPSHTPWPTGGTVALRISPRPLCFFDSHTELALPR
jgi:multiple sugar transport system ATP-binding protein